MKLVADYSYASTQVNFPESIAKRVIEWGNDRIPDSNIHEDPDDDSMGREDTVHCTVLYGLVDQDPEPVRELLAGERTVKATLGKITLFENDEFDVVKIDVKSPDLHRIHEQLSVLENENKFPEYKPHVTIAYVKPGSGSLYSGVTEFEGTEVTFDTVVFSPSDGETTDIRLGAGIAARLNWSV